MTTPEAAPIYATTNGPRILLDAFFLFSFANSFCAGVQPPTLRQGPRHRHAVS
jgi:hypothetical protein